MTQDPKKSNIAQFAKDKRKFSGDGEERKTQRPRPETSVRKSFNPNFTQDNKPAWKKEETDSRDKSPRGGKPEWKKSGTSSYGDKPRSGKPDWKKSDSKFGDKPRAGKPDWKQSKAGATDDKPWARKPFEDKRTAKDRPYVKKESTLHPILADLDAKTDDGTRLNRFIAAAGTCSRRDADQIIAQGRVMVNDVVVTEMGSKVGPKDKVRLDGKLVTGEQKVYILMNKPKGFVTTVEDPHADRTVIDIVSGKCKERVYPVGRLDRNSVGVLLITNDGDLTAQLTHPSYNKKKIYQVTLDRPLTKGDLDSIGAGLELEDGPVKVDAISWVGESKREVGVEIHSGRNRIVRRIFEHFGYGVVKLDRVYFAGLTKEGLRRGAWKYLSPQEVGMLKSGKYE